MNVGFYSDDRKIFTIKMESSYHFGLEELRKWTFDTNDYKKIVFLIKNNFTMWESFTEPSEINKTQKFFDGKIVEIVFIGALTRTKQNLPFSNNFMKFILYVCHEIIFEDRDLLLLNHNLTAYQLCSSLMGYNKISHIYKSETPLNSILRDLCDVESNISLPDNRHLTTFVKRKENTIIKAIQEFDFCILPYKWKQEKYWQDHSYIENGLLRRKYKTLLVQIDTSKNLSTRTFLHFFKGFKDYDSIEFVIRTCSGNSIFSFEDSENYDKLVEFFKGKFIEIFIMCDFKVFYKQNLPFGEKFANEILSSCSTIQIYDYYNLMKDYDSTAKLLNEALTQENRIIVKYPEGKQSMINNALYMYCHLVGTKTGVFNYSSFLKKENFEMYLENFNETFVFKEPEPVREPDPVPTFTPEEKLKIRTILEDSKQLEKLKDKKYGSPFYYILYLAGVMNPSEVKMEYLEVTVKRRKIELK